MNPNPAPSNLPFEQLVKELVFVGFNSKVVALSRLSGNLIWNWKSPKGTSSYVALLLDGDRLIVSVQGYTYCLDPLTGEQLWDNPLKGFGFGIPSLVSVRGSSALASAAAFEQISSDQQAAQHHHATGGMPPGIE